MVLLYNSWMELSISFHLTWCICPLDLTVGFEDLSNMKGLPLVAVDDSINNYDFASTLFI